MATIKNSGGGLVFLQKNIDFIGRDALMKQKEEGVKRMYIQLLLEDHDLETDLWPWGGEPIYRNGKQVGVCTTTGYGFTFKKQVKNKLVSPTKFNRYF